MLVALACVGCGRLGFDATTDPDVGAVAGGDASGDGGTTFAVGVAVSGLVGPGLVLMNNGVDSLPISTDGVFGFATRLGDGAGYHVTIASRPIGQDCIVTDAAGTIAGAPVEVDVTCFAQGMCPPVPLTFTTNDTFVLPTGCTTMTVDAYGGGGAGGGAGGLGTANVTAAAGGHGGHASKTFVGEVPGTAYTILIGAGGVCASALDTAGGYAGGRGGSAGGAGAGGDGAGTTSPPGGAGGVGFGVTQPGGPGGAGGYGGAGGGGGGDVLLGNSGGGATVLRHASSGVDYVVAGGGGGAGAADQDDDIAGAGGAACAGNVGEDGADATGGSRAGGGGGGGRVSLSRRRLRHAAHARGGDGRRRGARRRLHRRAGWGRRQSHDLVSLNRYLGGTSAMRRRSSAAIRVESGIRRANRSERVSSKGRWSAR